MGYGLGEATAGIAQIFGGGIGITLGSLTTGAGMQSHHGVNSVWMRANLDKHMASRAPAVLMKNSPAHNATRAVFNRIRAEIAKRLGVSSRNVDWTRVQSGTIWRIAEEQFEPAGVPKDVREGFFRLFNEYLETLQ